MNEATRATPDATRKPEAPGVAIVAGDGQAWHFSVPSRCIRAEVQGRRVASVRHLVGQLAEVEPAIDAVIAARDSGDEQRLIGSIFDLALARLLVCHRLDDGQASEVLTFSEAEFDRFGTELLLTIRGIPDDVPPDAPDLTPIPLADEPAEPNESDPL